MRLFPDDFDPAEKGLTLVNSQVGDLDGSGDLTVADLALASPFVNAGYAQYTVEAAKWPKFSALVERVKAHGAVAPLLEVEAAAFGG